MRIKRLYPIVFIAFVFFSCKEEKEPEIITFEELVGDTGAPTESADSSDGLVREPQTNFDFFVNSQLDLYDTFPHKKIHVLDRFGYNQQAKLDFLGKSKVQYGKSALVTPVASVYYYTFSDSVKTKSAFYNWLDCYGKDCNEVKLNQDVESFKSAPMFTLVYDTTIVAVEYLCEHEKNNWKSFEDSLTARFGSNYRYRIEVGCGGPLRWKK
jgi:hypothetical protein